MSKTSEIDELIKPDGEPEGITVQARDGRIFFLTNAEAKRFEVPVTRLYLAFSQLSQEYDDAPKSYKKAGGRPVRAESKSCRGLRRWLNTHKANSARWRAACLRYFDNC